MNFIKLKNMSIFYHKNSLLWLIAFLALTGLSALACSRQSDADLVDLATIDPSILVELKYAAKDNFVGQKLYNIERCILQRCAAERLSRVQARLRQQGLGLKVWDAYRPLSVQWKMWRLVPDPEYVADPRKGSRHNRGAAVDVTLVDLHGNELEMPTGFDDFSETAKSNFTGCSPEAIKNRTILHEAMKAEGFQPLSSEWWHFDDPNWKRFKVLDIPLENIQIK
jgi:D-alanyl-D-alanine dipeptidase